MQFPMDASIRFFFALLRRAVVKVAVDAFTSWTRPRACTLSVLFYNQVLLSSCYCRVAMSPEQ